MSWTELFISQVVDPFRLALLVALYWTMLRNRSATGIWLPLAAGAVFVAVIIPSTLTASATPGFTPQVALGLASNALILTLVHLGWRLAERLRARS